MKKAIVSILTAIMCLFGFVACGEPDKGGDANVLPTSITLDADSLALNVGDTYTLKATVAPSNATDKSVKFSVEGTAVTVDGKGKITAINEGTATVTAKTVNDLSATCSVTVAPRDDGSEHTRDGWIYYEDFSTRKNVPNYFNKDVAGFSRTEIEDGALRMTVINGGSGDHAFFMYEFKESLPERFVVEASVQSDSLAFANLLFMYDETDNYSNTSKIVANVAMDKGYIKNNAGSGWNAFIAPYETGKRYEMKMLVDTTEREYILFVDGTTSGRMGFRNNGEIKVLRFGSETAWADMSYYKIGVREATADDIAAIPQAFEYENDFAGTTKPQDIVIAESAGGKVDFSTDGEAAISTPTSGTVTVDKNFSKPLDGKYVAEVKFKNMSSANNTFANVLFLRKSALSGTAGNIVTLAVESGNLRYHNGSTWKTVEYDGGTIALVDGAYYTLSIVCDGDAKKYKMYLSGATYINSASGVKPLGEKVYLGEFGFRNATAGSPDQIEFAIGTGKTGTSFVIDRFKVYETDNYGM